MGERQCDVDLRYQLRASEWRRLRFVQQQRRLWLRIRDDYPRNGEMIVLDSAGYGPVVISKSISLIAPAGVYAGLTVFTGDGITVNGPGIIVVLRGLSINGQGGGYGIALEQAAHLRIENCVISNM